MELDLKIVAPGAKAWDDLKESQAVRINLEQRKAGLA